MSTPASQVIISIVPIVGIAVAGIVLFFYMLWHHKETTMLIRTGNYKPMEFNPKLLSFFGGLILTGVGCVLSILLGLIDGVSYALLGGLIPAVTGIMLLIFYKAYPDKTDKTDSKNN